MGLSSFLRGANSEPKKSAFDDIPDEVRQTIANDLCAIIECVKCWRPAIQSPEHAKAMVEEVIGMARKLGTKLIGAAISGNLDSLEDLFGSPEAIAKLGIPEAIKDIVARVKVQMESAVMSGCKHVMAVTTDEITVCGKPDPCPDHPLEPSLAPGI